MAEAPFDTTIDVDGFDPANRTEWPLAADLVYLNHGTVGVAPRRVLDVRERMLRQIETDPAAIIVRGIADIYGNGLAAPSRTRQALEPVATFVNAEIEGLAFVDNITAGANAALAALDLGPGDEILITSLGYGGIDSAARHTADRTGATLRVVDMPPLGAAPERFVDAVASGVGPATRVAVLDHLAANSALLLPIDEMVATCRDRGVITIVDGAHVPGAVELDVSSIGADFYAANLHKWAWCPRGIGFLAVAPAWVDRVHPAVTSWGYGRGFEAEFDFTGTRDPTPMLAVPAALALLDAADRGAVYRANRAAAIEAAVMLSERWQTEFSTPAEMVGPMVAIRLPDRFADDVPAELQARIRAHGIEVALANDVVPGTITARLACQRYVTADDIDRLGAVVDAL